MMTVRERDWLNSYHACIYETLSPLLDRDSASWLRAATAPI
jgi:Xaa-Pro aminopeptidase